MEVATTIVALDFFYEVTGKIKYKNQLDLAFSWFLGNNHLKQIMYNPENGSAFDGLEDKQVNINQGAESALCFLKAQLIIEKHTKSELTNEDVNTSAVKEIEPILPEINKITKKPLKQFLASDF